MYGQRVEFIRRDGRGDGLRLWRIACDLSAHGFYGLDGGCRIGGCHDDRDGLSLLQKETAVYVDRLWARGE
jgi:hypothetical protein